MYKMVTSSGPHEFSGLKFSRKYFTMDSYYNEKVEGQSDSFISKLIPTLH